MNSPALELTLWEEPLLRKYLGEVRRKCGIVETLALPSMRDLPTIQIETLFVPPLLSVTAVDPDTPPNGWPSGENLLSALQEHSQIVVLGDPGGGKTTLSNWLAWRLTSGTNAPVPSILENKLPIPCILRDMPLECFSEGGGVLELACAVAYKLLGSVADNLKHTFNEWIGAGKYVLILDGIDEIPVALRGAVASWMREAHRHSACVLATSRVIGYDDYPVDSFVIDPINEKSLDAAGEFQRESKSKSKSFSVKKRFMGYALKSEDGNSDFIDSSMARSWAQIRYLMPFDQVRISDFARNWYRQRCVTDVEAKQKTSDLLAALAQSEVTLNLARTPNLLSLMAIVHRERAHLPDGKALLYDEIVNAYLNTIDKQRKIGPDDLFANYGWKERKSWLAYVGFKIQAERGWNRTGAGILVTEEEVLSWLMEAMESTGLYRPHDIAQEFLNWVARRSGLLLPRGESRYAFVHLSFQEYFCACYLESCIVRPAFVMDKLPATATVTKKSLSHWAKIPSWTETLIFLFELLSAEHDVEWVRSLLEIVHDTEQGSTSRLSARLIKNKHVKLSSDLHDVLADGCVSWVFNEWSTGPGAEADVISTLIDSGHCALFADLNNDDTAIPAAKVLSMKAWEKDPSRVRVLIIKGDFQLSQDQLQRMVNLKGLIVEDGCVIDFRRFHMLSFLKIIRLSDVNISGIESLGDHVTIENLRISGVNMSNLSPLSRLKNITYLELDNLSATDISPLVNCKKLVLLQLANMNVYDLNPLISLRKVETLLLSNIPAEDISGISSMRRLDYVQLCNMPVRDLSPLRKCIQLESIDLENLDVSDLTPLSDLKQVEGVFLSKLPVRSMSPLWRLPGLKYLYVKGLPLLDIETLGGCDQLTSLSLLEMSIHSIEFIRNLNRLKVLALGDLRITDITPLKSLSSLTYLDMYRVDVSDVSMLAELPSLSSFVTTRDSDFDLAILHETDRIAISFSAEE